MLWLCKIVFVGRNTCA